MQVVIWVFSFILFYLKYSTLPLYYASYIFALTVHSFVFFAVIVYGYMYLYNKLFYRVIRIKFISIVGFLFIGLVLIKIYLENTFSSKLTEVYLRSFYSGDGFISFVHFANNFGSCFFALITGALFKSFTESLYLREKQAEIQKKHLQTELNILKAQVQPHFLFNSFNNLYYDTYKTLPLVAERLVMLSDIMRYFMEESPKERVPLSTEIEFVKDIVRLEQVRISCPVTIIIDENIDTKLLVPPMLLIPLVENVFKHGVKSNEKDNTIDIKIMHEKNKLNFYTKNKLNTKSSIREGIGLQNLRERLTLLFKDEFTLNAFQQEEYFIVMLTIPVYEN